MRLQVAETWINKKFKGFYIVQVKFPAESYTIDHDFEGPLFSKTGGTS